MSPAHSGTGASGKGRGTTSSSPAPPCCFAVGTWPLSPQLTSAGRRCLSLCTTPVLQPPPRWPAVQPPSSHLPPGSGPQGLSVRLWGGVHVTEPGTHGEGGGVECCCRVDGGGVAMHGCISIFQYVKERSSRRRIQIITRRCRLRRIMTSPVGRLWWDAVGGRVVLRRGQGVGTGRAIERRRGASCGPCLLDSTCISMPLDMECPFPAPSSAMSAGEGGWCAVARELV